MQCKECVFVFLSYYHKIRVIRVRFGARVSVKARLRVGEGQRWVRVRLQMKILTFILIGFRISETYLSIVKGD